MANSILDWNRRNVSPDDGGPVGVPLSRQEAAIQAAITNRYKTDTRNNRTMAYANRNGSVPLGMPDDQYRQGASTGQYLDTSAPTDVVNQAKYPTKPVQPLPVNRDEFSQDSYYQSLMKSATDRANLNYTTAMNTLRNNLSQTLANLNATKAALTPEYQSTLGTISRNQFSTTAQQKELMGQAGWNMDTSGLAVGEVGKIAASADQSRSDETSKLNERMSALAMQIGNANSDFATQKKNLGLEKQYALSQAQQDAYATYTSAKESADKATTDEQIKVTGGTSMTTSEYSKALNGMLTAANPNAEFMKLYDSGVVDMPTLRKMMSDYKAFKAPSAASSAFESWLSTSGIMPTLS